MSTRERWIAVLLALAGIGLCLSALVTFFMTIINNRLPWHPEQTAQDHYLAVGRAYSQGFSIGFFLCFFLALISVAVSAWFHEHRRRKGNAARAGLFRRSPAPTREQAG